MTQANPITHDDHTEELRGSRRLTGVVYLLQILALATGGITLLIAAAIIFATRDKVRGTWLESHYQWQNKTIWFALILIMFGAVTFRVGIGGLILLAAATYLIYRVFRGWSRWNLNEAIDDAEL